MSPLPFPRAGHALAMILGAALALAAAPASAAAPVIEKSVKPAAGLYEIVASPSTGTVYVAGTGAPGARIVALDAATLQTKSSIDVSAAPLFGLGLNEKTQTLYGTATRTGVVSAIDLASGKVVASIRHGEGAHVREAIVDEAANRVYVSIVAGRGPVQQGATPEPSSVWVIDGRTNTLADVIPVEAAALTGIALDAQAQRLYGTAMGSNEIVVVDLAQKKLVQRWSAGGEGPTNLVLDPATQRLFVANQQTGTLTVLDARDGRLLKSVQTGDGALSVAFHPGRQQVYVANRQAGTLTVVDAKSYEVIANLPTGTLPQTIAIDSKTGLVYVTNKARGRPRNAPADAPAAEDPAGDTVTLIRP